MSQLMENVYDIKELYVVKLDENYKEYLPNLKNNIEDVEYFNTNLYYIVEKFKIDSKNNNVYEFYTECVVGRCFFERLINNQDESIPNIFSEFYKFPIECLSSRERTEGKISTSRIFQIFQQINCCQLNLENTNQDNQKTMKLVNVKHD